MASLEQDLEAISRAALDAQESARAFENGGNKAAGTRVRVAMQSIKNQAQAVRVKVQAMKNKDK